MIINNGTIREALQNFNTVFNKTFQEMEAQYPRVAMGVSGTTIAGSTSCWACLLKMSGAMAEMGAQHDRH